MQKTIPIHLSSTYQLLQRAFPQGVDERFYWPLLSILQQQMSDRNLAEVIAELTGRDYHAVLNDVYRVAAAMHHPIQPPVSPELIQSVQQKLTSCGYAQWLVGES